MAFELSYSLCFLLILLQLPFFTIAKSSNKISLNSSLTARGNGGSNWASPSGEFAFGFRKVGNAGFLLAIWYNKVSDMTIVWSANRNHPVQQRSRVDFSAKGKLTLTDVGTGKATYIADDQSTANGVAYAAMLDTGNFVLATRNKTYLWQSFDHPTDTILPKQTLNLNSSLFAQLTATNYSEGRFKFILQPDGNLMLYTVNYPFKIDTSLYWSIQTGSGFQVIFNQNGSIYLIAKNGSNIGTLFKHGNSDQEVYSRATLDYDGVLRHYTHQKTNDGTGSWFMWPTIPSNICTAIVERTGGGACGFNSLCGHEEAALTNCSCPPSYVHVDQDDVRKGCKQNFVPHSCDKASSESDLFHFHELEYTDWPGGDYDHLQPVSKEQCKQSCLADCFCAAAIFNESCNDCWKKAIPLSNGNVNSNVSYFAAVKIRKDTSSSTSTLAKERDIFILIGAVIIIVLTNLAVSIITYVVSSHAKVSQLPPLVKGIHLKCFTFLELKEATHGFKEELGRGAFATVFKGVLASDSGKFIAVKRLNTVVKENDLDFKAEVTAVGGTNHRNLVQLLGFCNEKQHQLLVYEYMSNGSLTTFLFGESRPDWNKRKQIALGTARGLLYLHEECSTQIIHCDIKPQNILLDDTFTARIADFGVSKLLKSDQSRTTTRIRGTKGYVAPEWFKSLPVTVKVDVYSYGIVLLEIVCCRKNYEPEAPEEDQMILADWAYDCYKQKKLYLLLQNVDEDQAMDDMMELEKYLMIAFWCIQEDPSVRPTIKKVTHMLEGIVEVSVPPNLSSECK